MIRIDRVVSLVLVLVIAVSGVGIAVAAPDGRAAPAEASAGDTVARTVERAADRVERRRACRPVPVARLIDGAPSTALLETLGVLRREQTAEERAAIRYPSVLRRTEPVQDNVVGFVVARRAEDAFPLRMVWRATDGSIVRVVEIEGSYFVVSRRRAHATTSR